MASIKVSELRPAGSELFQDSESFLNELTESREMENVLGGRGKIVIGLTITVQSINGNTFNANTYGNNNTVAI